MTCACTITLMPFCLTYSKVDSFEILIGIRTSGGSVWVFRWIAGLVFAAAPFGCHGGRQADMTIVVATRAGVVGTLFDFHSDRPLCSGRLRIPLSTFAPDTLNGCTGPLSGCSSTTFSWNSPATIGWEWFKLGFVVAFRAYVRGLHCRTVELSR